MIISASRRTDIPAFYSDWFFNRIKEGFVYVRNPINKHQISEVSLSAEDVDCFVFWTKNPKPFISRIAELNQYKFYFQYTLNSYGIDLEPAVPQTLECINTFIELSKIIGKEKVIWRYDPIVISEKYTLQYHLTQFESIANTISGYTEKCVISFVDLYKKSERNLTGTNVRELKEEEILMLAKELKVIANKYNLELNTCAESIDLELQGIKHNSCIDKVLIEKLIYKKVRVSKDQNQRKDCKCIESVDIGSYNTCTHGCLYCYANINPETVAKNLLSHSIYSPLLFGAIGQDDIIKKRK